MKQNDSDDRNYLVVMNDANQYSIWPNGMSVPDGWHLVGVSGTRQVCLAHIGRIWPGDVGQGPGFLLGEVSARCNDQKAGRNAVRDCIHQLVEEQAAAQPNHVAVVDGVSRHTYLDLNGDANRLAHHLRALGIAAEVPVAISMHHGYNLIVTLLAVLKAGGVYVPIPPDLPVERAGFMLRDTGARILVTQSGTPLADTAESNPTIDIVAIDSVEYIRESESLPDDNMAIPQDPANAAYVIYTSGSTGLPKGVVVTHQNVIRLFNETAAQFRFTRDDVWTLFHSYAFDFSVWEIWGALIHGGRLVVVTSDVARTPHKLLDLLGRQRVTVLNLTPSAFGSLVDVVEDNLGAAHQLALRTVIFGGEALNCDAVARWMDLLGGDGPQLVNMYGITETTVHVSYKRILRSALNAYCGGASSPVGRPIQDLRVHLLDNALKVVPAGEAGEIYVAGAGLARGYLNRPELTAERFLPEIQGRSGERMYKTGDLARLLPNGELEFLGRVDNQVKIRGFRVELGEVEGALMACANVDAAAVVAYTSPVGDTLLVGYTVSKKGVEVDPQRLRAELSLRLPDYMLPTTFVPLQSMPLTSNGKLDRRAIAQFDTSALQIRSRLGNGGSYVALETEVERYLAQLWQELLGVEGIGVADDFFKLGGHSLLAVRAQQRIRRDLGVSLDFMAMFNNTTLGRLAAEIESHEAS